MAEVDLNALASAAQSVSNDWSLKANAFLANLNTLAATQFNPTLADTNLPVQFTTRDSEMRTAIDSKPAKPGGLTFSTNAAPASQEVSIREAVQVTVPTLTATAPTLDLPTRPAQTTPDRPTAPALNAVDVPPAPTVTLPTAPTFMPVTFPNAPSITLPTFEQAFPADVEFLLQTTSFEWTEEDTATPLMDAAGTKLLGDIQNGGYGIETNDEDALWERARDRAARQGQAAEAEALEAFASRGHSLPPGASVAAVQEARRQADEAISETGREISVARANLFRENRQFALQQGVAVDNIRLQQAGFKMERALNAARFSAEFAIQVHDALVRGYNAKVASFEAYTRSYGALLEAELTKVRIYEAEVRAAVEQQRSQQIEVDLYEALITAERAHVDLYEAQVRAMLGQLEAERLKLETYRTQVEAFSTEVRANAVEFQAYEAGVRGEVAKSQNYAIQVDAYRTQVQAAGLESDIRNKSADLDVERSRAVVANYVAQVQGFQAKIAQETSRVESLLREYGEDTTGYSAALNAWEGLVRVTISEIESITRQTTNEVELEQVNARLQLEAAVEGARRRFEAANSGSLLTRAFTEQAGESLGMIGAQLTEVTS